MPTIIIRSRLGLKFEQMTMGDYKSYKALVQMKREGMWAGIRSYVDNKRQRRRLAAKNIKEEAKRSGIKIKPGLMGRLFG